MEGHMSAWGENSVSNFAAASLLWRDWQWWKLTQASNEMVNGSAASWRRPRAGRVVFWEHLLVSIFGDRWKSLAMMPGWAGRRLHFVVKSYERLGISRPEHRFGPLVSGVAPLPESLEAVRPEIFPPSDKWDGVFWRRLLIRGDSKLVVNWCNGTWAPSGKSMRAAVSDIVETLFKTRRRENVRPCGNSEDYFQHVYREYNAEADSLTKCGDNRILLFPPVRQHYRHHVLYFDGSQTKTTSAMAWVFQARFSETDPWETLAECNYNLEVGTTAIEAEISAAKHGVEFVGAYLRGRALDFVAAARPPVAPARRRWVPTALPHYFS
jgi:ribonuclease HI